MSSRRVPIVDCLVLDDGSPHLVAHEAVESGALYLQRHNADPRTGATEFRRRTLASTGQVRSFTIVHRDAPGIAVPYVSAVVELDGGGTVRANLVDVEPDPAHIELGMRVELTTFVAGVDSQGTQAVAFAFRPRTDEP